MSLPGATSISWNAAYILNKDQQSCALICTQIVLYCVNKFAMHQVVV